MLPQMAFTSSLATVALLLCFSFSVNPQTDHIYPTATAPASWTNSPSLPHNFTFDSAENVRYLLLLPLKSITGMAFAFGFYCSQPCKSFFLSICIISADYNNYGHYYRPHVIWSANRAHPVSENATLQLTSKDGLTLCDSDGSLVWSTSGLNRAVAGINITDTGNLVLFDINNYTIWQSFDHPTDCLVMGQTLAGGMRLIANYSSIDLAEGQFYLTLLEDSLYEDGLYGFVNSNPPLAYYYKNFPTTSNGKVDNSAFIKFMNGSLTVLSKLQDTDNNTIIFTFAPTKSIQYMRLESDGHLRLYDFDDYQWKMVGDLFNMEIMDGGDYSKMENCAYPTVCGPYGICNNGQCTCPAGNLVNYFKLVDNRRAELGCSTITNITCHVKSHLMLELNNVSYFNNINHNGSFYTTEKDTCKNACLGDCNCKAAMFLSSARMCFTLPEVFSFKNQLDADYQSSIYIKVQASSSKVGLGVILGSTFGALLFMLTLTSICIVFLRRREEEQDEDIIKQLPGMPTRFTFEELRVATENFVKILGKGGFGTVFEGRWGDERIAVKRLDNVGHGNKDFLAEVEAIVSIHHINLVRLIGFCADKLNRLLVYEYMYNGSLDKWIYCRDGRVPLDWPIRFKIITDIAKGLCYLHEECRQKIVHFDIKPANILLDEKFNAKVSDFGLSKLIDRDISTIMTKKMRGTPGYLAPEWQTSMVTEKVDIYSFGVVVMEILSGRRNVDDSQTEGNCHLIKLLEEKSKSNSISDLIDKNVGDVELYEEKIVNVMKLAMWCLQWDSTRRPSMLIVVKVLEGAMEVETSLDYNFVSSIPIVANLPSIVDQSAPFPASVLSGPR